MGETPGSQVPPERVVLDAGVLQLRGDVDVSDVDRLVDVLGTERAALGRVLVAAGVRAIDLGEASFIDSSVLGLVLAVAGALDPVRLQLRGVHGEPLMVLQAVGVDALVDLVTDAAASSPW